MNTIRKSNVIALSVAALALGTGASALAAGGGGDTTADGTSGSTAASRLDDGKSLVGQATISEAQAITAAQTRASGALNEVDLEHSGGKLVWTVDVGSHDVKVDAASGDVVSVDQDD